MRPLTDGERDVLREQEADVRDLDDGGFDRDEWVPPDLLDEAPDVPVVVFSPPPVPDLEHPW